MRDLLILETTKFISFNKIVNLKLKCASIRAGSNKDDQ